MLFPSPLAELSYCDKQALLSEIEAELAKIIQPGTYESNCSECLDALAAAKPAALYVPSLVPAAMASLCKKFKFRSNASCEEDYGISNFGAYWTQVLALADVVGLDGQYVCSYLSTSFCEVARASPCIRPDCFSSQSHRPPLPRQQSGRRVNALRLSDIHLDPPYSTGSEANCSSGLCCRLTNHNRFSKEEALVPAPAYGSFRCDSSYDLTLAALQAIWPLTGTGKGKCGMVSTRLRTRRISFIRSLTGTRPMSLPTSFSDTLMR